MVIDGKAGMQIMGDWARASSAASKVAGKDYQCLPFPGTQGSFTFNIDSLAMFKLSSDENRKAEDWRARCCSRSSRPSSTRTRAPSRFAGRDMSEFDACAQQSMKDFKAAAGQRPATQPDPRHGRVELRAGRGVRCRDQLLQRPQADPQKAARQLAAAIRAVQ